MLPRRTLGELGERALAEVGEQGAGQPDQLGARPRVDSGIDFHDARPWSVLEGDEEPSAGDVERQRAYADWLARFEPAQEGRRQREGLVGGGADQVDARPGERAA